MGVQEADIDAMEAQFPGLFTREQIKGVLESFKDNKEGAIANLRFKQCKSLAVSLPFQT